MKIFLGNNGHGKTESLVSQSIKTGATIVCFDQIEKNRLISNYGKDLPTPITFEEFTNDRFISGRIFKGILLDNVIDHLQRFASMARADIEGVSINCDPSDITILKEPPYKNGA